MSKENQRQAFLFCLMFRHKQNVDVSVIWPSNLILASVAFLANRRVQLKCQRLPALDSPHTGEAGEARGDLKEPTADFQPLFDNLPSSKSMAAPIRLSQSAPLSCAGHGHVGAGKS